ncbi:MAG: single-stranded-DNA-specific exonuclease RecJ [Bacteroidota bacterium]
MPVEKTWILSDQPEERKINELSKVINVNVHLSKILVQRGICTFNQAKDFFRPSLSHLHDPFLMKNMSCAVNRLTEAVFSKEKILIYGDYDVDGTTSVSLMYLFLRDFTDQLEYYIPDRYTEGYGISEVGIDYASENQFSLIIALDCGIRAVDRARQASALGIDLIICDHHLPGLELPKATAILDPKQEDCSYPFKELSGCGVGFKILQGFCQQNTIPKEKLFSYLDLVAVSIASDIVPIVGENRILAFYGLKKLNESPSAGLKSLIEISGRKKKFSISDVVFSIGPRINAAGRLAHAKESVKLLIGDEADTDKFADVLNDRNTARRTFDQQITAEALSMIAELPASKKSTVLFKEDWHKGVIGIVASRCIERYHRPTIILTSSNGVATGSARSVEGFDVHAAIHDCAHLLSQYGGHRHAAGLSLPLSNVKEFIAAFEEVVGSKILPEKLVPKLEIDCEIPLTAINYKMYSILNQMAPFGPGNPSPIFSARSVVIDTEPTILKEKHVKGFMHDVDSTKLFEFIGFGLAEKMAEVQLGQPFQVAFHLEENEYLGNRSLILNIKDIKTS